MSAEPLAVHGVYDDEWEAQYAADRLYYQGKRAMVMTVLEANRANVAGREIRTADRWVVLVE